MIDVASSCGPLQIRILDHDLMPVAESTGRLETSLPPGVYRLEFGIGKWIETRYFTLHPGSVHRDHALSMSFPTAFPVGSLDEREIRQLELIGELSNDPTSRRGDGEGLLLSARRDPRGADESQEPLSFEDLLLLDGEGRRVAELEPEARNEVEDDWAGVHLQLEPGAYRLQWSNRRASRWSESDRIVQEQALWIQPGWITGIFFLASPSDGKPNMGGMSVHMRRTERGFEGVAGPEAREKNLAAELVLESLRGGEPVGMVQRELLELLLEAKYQDPMLGIVGAHALLGERGVRARGSGDAHSGRRGPRWTVFDTVVRNLQEKLVPDHPDVKALRWLGKVIRERSGRARTRTRSEPLRWPPMVYAGCAGALARTWDEETVVVRGSPLERIAPHLQRRGPWTAWEAVETREPVVPTEATTGREVRDAEEKLQRIVQKLGEHSSSLVLESPSWSSAERQVGQFIARKLPLTELEDRPLTFDRLRGTGLSRHLVVSALGKLSEKL